MVGAPFSRVVLNEEGEREAYSDYYPYGLAMSPSEVAPDNYRYGYQGQFAEKDEETGWDAFQLRMYKPAIGRWLGPDPYRQFYSAYVGMGNNPVVNIDPDGGYCVPCLTAAIGALANVTWDMASGKIDYQSLLDPDKASEEWLKVGISIMEGATAGFTGGTGGYFLRVVPELQEWLWLEAEI